TLTREQCRVQAVAIGPATATVVGALLDHRPEDRLRAAGRLVRLAQTCSAERLERACLRAQAFGATDYATVKRILAEGLDQQPLPLARSSPAGAWPEQRPAPPRAYAFVRQASEFVSALFGGGLR